MECTARIKPALWLPCWSLLLHFAEGRVHYRAMYQEYQRNEWINIFTFTQHLLH